MLVLVTGINIGLNLAFWIKNLYCMYLVLTYVLMYFIIDGAKFVKKTNTFP